MPPPWDKCYPSKVVHAEVTSNHADGSAEYVTYTVDAGRQKFELAYVGRWVESGGFRYAGPVPLEAELLPDHSYVVEGKAGDRSVVFILRDRSTGAKGGRTAAAEVVLRGSKTEIGLDYLPAAQGTHAQPIFGFR